jgi:hypothetical protein
VLSSSVWEAIIQTVPNSCVTFVSVGGNHIDAILWNGVVKRGPGARSQFKVLFNDDFKMFTSDFEYGCV